MSTMALPTVKIHIHSKKMQKLCGGEKVVVSVGQTIRQAFIGLVHRFGPQMDHYLRENHFQLYKNRYNKDNYEDFINEQTNLDEKHEGQLTVHLYPHVKGSGRAGRIIAGVVLIVVGYFVTGLSYGWAAPVGNALISAGIGLILQGLFMPKVDAADKPDERANYVFNQAVNTMAQGGPVPLYIGLFRGGSNVVATGVDVAQLPTYTAPLNGGIAPDNMFWQRVV